MADAPTTTTEPAAPDAASTICGPGYSTVTTQDVNGVAVAVARQTAPSSAGLVLEGPEAPAYVACVESTSGRSTQSCGFYEDETGHTMFIEATMQSAEYEARLLDVDGAEHIALSGALFSECAEEISYTNGASSSFGGTSLSDALEQHTRINGDQLSTVIDDLVGWTEFQDPATPLAASTCASLSFLDAYAGAHDALGLDAYWTDIDGITAGLGDEKVRQSLDASSREAAGAASAFDEGSFVAEKLIDLAVIGVGWGIVVEGESTAFDEEVHQMMRAESIGSLATFDYGFTSQAVTVEQLLVGRANRCS